MHETRFIKKEGLSLSSLALYLLGCQEGERLKTIEELARDYSLSIGLMQGALKTLEKADCIRIKRRGRNGSFLVHVDYQALLKYSNINRLVCAMPLPYTLKYEGLASGLKREFSGIPFYFAHMRGADARVECLRNGIYDLAVVSRLAAEAYINQPDNNVKIAMMLGENSWVSHQVIRRFKDRGQVRKVGVDSRSMDQKLLTNMVYDPLKVEYVEISYHECLNSLKNGNIDAVIWNVENTQLLEQHDLEIVPVKKNQYSLLAAEAVILIRNGDKITEQILDTFVDIDRVKMHQKAVIARKVEPSY